MCACMSVPENAQIFNYSHEGAEKSSKYLHMKVDRGFSDVPELSKNLEEILEWSYN